MKEKEESIKEILNILALEAQDFLSEAKELPQETQGEKDNKKD